MRERIASRLSNLKSRGTQTPILNEVVLPAEVISVDGFTVPRLDAYSPQAIGDFLNNFTNFPSIAWGKAMGVVAGQWYAVKYPKTMTGAVPVVVGLGRLGSIITRAIDKVQDINLKTIPLVPDLNDIREILRINRDDFNSNLYCDKVAAGARDRAKQLAPPWPLDLIWNWFCDTFVYAVFFFGWLGGGWVLNVLWDSFVQPQVDRVRDSINGIAGDVNAKVNAQLTQIQNAVNSVIGDANVKINDQINAIQDAVNLRLNDLYNMWGLPTNVVPTPLHVRNATAAGFEFQSYGNTTAYWVAVGKPSGI